KALRSDPAQRSAAVRALLSAAVTRREDPHKLMELARELQSYPEATWNDRLVFLDLLHGTQDPQFSSYLAELEKKAADNPGSLAALLSWMSRSNMNLLALDYIKGLPADPLEKWPVPIAVADIDVQLRDWSKLETMTTKTQWGRFDFLRHAYLSRALR